MKSCGPAEQVEQTEVIRWKLESGAAASTTAELANKHAAAAT